MFTNSVFVVITQNTTTVNNESKLCSAPGAARPLPEWWDRGPQDIVLARKCRSLKDPDARPIEQKAGGSG